MDRKECLEIKKLILKISQDERSEIPPLSYSFVEIINPGYINQTLIEEIDNENPNFSLTDNLFFECVGGNVNYLAYEPFRKKIKDWQDKLIEPGVSADEQKKAKNNLSRISKALLKPFHKRSRPPKFKSEKSEWNLYKEYQELIQQFKPFIKETKNYDIMYSTKFKKLFNERFPELAKYSSAIGIHRTEKSIAKAILIKKYDVSKRKLLEILKYSETMEMKLLRPSTLTVPRKTNR